MAWEAYPLFNQGNFYCAVVGQRLSCSSSTNTIKLQQPKEQGHEIGHQKKLRPVGVCKQAFLFCYVQ